MAEKTDPTTKGDCMPLSKRRLVTVRRISKIEGIQYTKRVALWIDGWKVVVPKLPPYKVGDLVVFFQIDCFIPKDDRFWELFASPNGPDVYRGREGYRVKSLYYGSDLSQGLVFPLAQFPEINGPYEAQKALVGTKAATEELLNRPLADVFRVEKWEYLEGPACHLPDVGRPPQCIRLPAWWRIQDIEGRAFARKSKQKTWQITEKLDGVTMMIYKISRASRWADCIPDLPEDCPSTMLDETNRYGVCSRHQDFIDRDDNIYWQTARKSGVLDIIRDIDLPNVAIQGELCGSSICGNTMKYPDGEHEFVVFNIWKIDGAEYLKPRETAELCAKLGIKHVPILGYVTLEAYAKNAGEVLKKAEGTGRFGGVREGVVFKAVDGSEQFKAISNSWLSLTGK